jgi:hypothetical protein
MAAWRINAVRLPLNESCWLGINGVDPSAGGAAYQQAIKAYVALLHAKGMYAIIELYANAPGGLLAVNQQNGPDADHSVAFWTSVAAAFRDDPAVVFDLFNEPIIDNTSDAGRYTPATADAWDCWRIGGCSALFYNTGQTTINPDGSSTDHLERLTWPMVGMQQLLNAVRSSGATQPVLLGGLTWTLDKSGWLTHLPFDPENQLAASIHLYDFSGGGFNSTWTFDDWARDVATIARRYPVVTGELGVGRDNYKFVDDYMTWADALGVSYLMYTWVRWHEGGVEVDTGITVIRDYAGTPSPMGKRFYDHMRLLQSDMPAAPTALTASAVGSSVTLSWVAPTTGAAPTSYVIEAGSSAGAANLANFSTGTAATTFATTGVGSGTYYVRVRAVSAVGMSAPSNEAVLVVGTGPCTAPPGAPGNLSIVSVSNGTVLLTWNGAAGSPTSYLVEAGSSPGGANLANSDLGSAATSLTATGVGRGLYYVRIRASNVCGLGPASNEVVLIVP